MNWKKILGVSAVAGTMLVNSAFAFAAGRETIHQVALLQSLKLGHFDGSLSIKALKKLGDIGIGTFEGLNGEMIVLDGVVYQGDQNCHANIMNDAVTVPFSNVTFFDNDFAFELKDVETKSALEDILNVAVENYGVNSFYMLKIPCTLNNILIRSEARSNKPYPTLVKALESQKEVSLENIDGTIVGLYCPPYMGGLNTVGWHFNFISSDKKFAGHVLGLNIKTGEAQFDKTDNFALHLPGNNADFNSLNLAADLSEDVHKAENESKER